MDEMEKLVTKKTKIVQIDIKCHKNGTWGARFYRVGKLSYGGYENITPCSMMRGQRAQYALVGQVR